MDHLLCHRLYLYFLHHHLDHHLHFHLTSTITATPLSNTTTTSIPSSATCRPRPTAPSTITPTSSQPAFDLQCLGTYFEGLLGAPALAGAGGPGKKQR